MDGIKNYKCPACGGGLSFSASTGKVKCPYCDSSFDAKEIEDIYNNANNQTDIKDDKIDQESTVEADEFDSVDSQWNTDALNQEWGDDAGEMVQYSCPSCGAAIVCHKTTAATNCPYCDNPVVLQQQFSNSLKPDLIIPFKVEKKEAISLLKKFYENKPLLPKEFENENHLEEIKGVYVPFWLFDGTAYGDATFHATKSEMQARTNATIEITHHYKCERSGDVEFSKVPVDASKQMDNALMDSIEPFNYEEMTTFSTGYLPGYLANIYDDKVEDCFSRANKRCSETCIKTLRNSVHGYSSVRLVNKNIKLKQGSVHYGMLPVWILNTKYEDKRYIYAINGQTGKVVGELPVSGAKTVSHFFKRFFISLIISALVATAAIYFLGI